MSAIYQRARPIRWDQVVGQEHVKDVLKTALEQGRVGHAYLFSGPRGVGKTTTARLIAMTANCTGPSPKPCGECESCLAVRAGSHPDVLEIDAASNNSVDDVRDLREKVSLAAMRGGKKIYILDEAHMMSRAAFNALLKTLEEPPSHVIFILATTEPEKIIPTILSRCQHYRFRRLTPEEIAGKLAGLAQREGMTAEPEALNLIGRLADGAMRDGESLLERMLAAGTAVTKAAVEDALGLPPGERVRGIAGALVLGDAATALQGAAALYREGFAARTVVEGLVAAFADALHAELGLEGQALEGADVPRLLKLQAALDEQESRFARSADGLSLELALTHALLAADGGGATSAPAGAAAASSVPADVTQRLSRLERELAELRTSGVRAGPAPTQEAPAPQPTARRSAPATPPPIQEAPVSAPVPVQGNWADVTRQASMQLRAFLKPARMHAEPGYVSLSYDEKNAFHAKQIASKFDEVATLVLKVFGPVTFELVAPEGGRRVRLGGGGDGPGPGGGGGGGGVSPSPGPAPASPPPARAAAPKADIPAFEPSPRPRASRGPDFAPVERAAPEKPVAQAAPQARAATATLDAPPPAPLRPAPPPSPDDVAPAPLAESGPAPWEDDHAADPPPPPEGAQGGDRVAPPGASRELYIVEEVTQEPDWDDIGGSVDGPAPSLEDAPFADVVSARPAPTPRPAVPAPAPAQAAPSRPGDIRAHPLYEEIKGRFSGRVREIGKNRRVQAAAADAPGADDEGEAEGPEAQT
ncbi:DNA polymerase-3 subunit gamma/tau [Deinococcus sp. HSC-46F16]|uniref:DNA polymerase III subunit gamma/tau n=1 Tax=Deinococcus sp. HSC-46F16 TaxID=2910968 RepID=UPI0020A0997A|nr:DNA polymerase III subunit gamma/tau [Deinococcus sp. HSC-46F16]MCP2014292.1 DNA polymerase-3 subunit gamma/tau [Deinococcus sp. HSC-46F16]